MVGIGIDFGADIREMQNDLPSVFEWSGKTLRCIVSALSAETLVETGGEYSPSDREVLLRYSDFQGSFPGTRDTVTVDETKYYVQNIDRDEKTDSVRMVIGRI
jgi:hypothetical protein